MRIDLHTHSTVSDGTDTPAELVAAARLAGLDVVALTDHDTTAGWREATDALPDGLTLIPGAEISCRLGATPLHLLAYLFDPSEPEFARERALLRDDRVRRARAIVARAQDLGAPITWQRVAEIAGEAVVGRPHIASALVEAGVIATVSDAFTPEWLADGGRAHVGKYEPDPLRAIQLVLAAGGVPVVAHAAAGRLGRNLTDDEIALLARHGLAGIEVDHPDHDEAARERLHGLAGELDLIETGSSDYHGDRKTLALGEHTTDPRALEEILARATGTRPRTAGATDGEARDQPAGRP